ncbi:MAG: lytic transglycosylase domain-containing protein [Proteobacteria bacterium]|nr:lytic transglycosylase domain-containing protein [Pseudomonadota bacterium]MDA1287342.1 lytic transglycosylase domain-containing protein [Pseudomonadota bacterium]
MKILRKHVGLATICAIMYLSGPLYSAEPFKDFTFHRVKPPKPGAQKRITIQVEPTAPLVIAKIDKSPTATLTTPGQTDWFWESISPKLSDGAPGRFQEAVLKIVTAPADKVVPTPRAQDLRQIALTYGTEILLATLGKKISPALVLAMITTESGGRQDAESGAGASGLMQLMPATAARFSVTDIKDPAQNIKGGVAYLEWLLEKFDGDPILALAAYNAGENAVIKNGGVPEYAETRAYVPKVVAAFQVARALCKTPPELYSDGCVFDVKEQ